MTLHHRAKEENFAWKALGNHQLITPKLRSMKNSKSGRKMLKAGIIAEIKLEITNIEFSS
jgi:hypothetical protein